MAYDAIVTQALAAYRDYVVDGVVSTGPNDPAKADIRNLWIALGAVLDAFSSTGGAYVGFTTQALMFANLAYPAGTVGEVLADSTTANDGLYLKSGASGSGAWTQVSTLTLPGLAASLAAEVTRATNAEATKAPLISPALTGTPTAPTAPPGTNTTQIATTAFVVALASFLAPLLSPAFTGNPTAPTQALSDNSTRLATTAFVVGALSAGAVVVRGTGLPNLVAPVGTIYERIDPTGPNDRAYQNIDGTNNWAALLTAT
jgi:hypothetical protein